MAIPMEEFEPTYKKLATQEVAKILGVLPRTVTSYVKRGKLSPCYRGSFGKLYFEESDVLILKQKNESQKSGSTPNHNRLSKRTDYEMKIIKEWQVQPKDIGSLDVQIGLLTQKIEDIEEKLIFLQKDEIDFKIVRMHLLRLTNERRRNLDLLRKTDIFRYRKALDKLGLKA